MNLQLLVHQVCPSVHWSLCVATDPTPSWPVRGRGNIIINKSYQPKPKQLGLFRARLEKSMRSDPTLRNWYRIINRRFFDSQLPNDVCVRWAEDSEEDDERWEEKYFGSADKARDGRHSYVIVMSRKLNIPASTRLITLCHEMCHIATELKDNHGPAFEYWRQYIADRGIFKKNALRKGLTIF